MGNAICTGHDVKDETERSEPYRQTGYDPNALFHDLFSELQRVEVKHI